MLVAQSCPTLCDPMDCSPPGFSVHEILQAIILEWVAISFSRWSSWTWVSCTASRFFSIRATMEAPLKLNALFKNGHSRRRRKCKDVFRRRQAEEKPCWKMIQLHICTCYIWDARGVSGMAIQNFLSWHSQIHSKPLLCT